MNTENEKNDAQSENGSATEQTAPEANPTASTSTEQASAATTTGTADAAPAPEAKPSPETSAASAPQRVKFVVTGSVKGDADVLVGTTVAEALKLAGVKEAASNLNLRDAAGKAAKPEDVIAAATSYTASGGGGESRYSASEKMNGG